MVTAVRTQETREEAITRLAAKARAEGVKLYRDPKDGRYYASSVSNPDKLHYVTGISCDCAGFASHQRCKHHSALLVALGWVGGVPEPEPEPITGKIVRCQSCRGLGEVHYTRQAGRHRFVDDWQTCPTCHGTGEESLAA